MTVHRKDQEEHMTSTQERSVPNVVLHRRRGRRQGVPGLRLAQLQLLHPQKRKQSHYEEHDGRRQPDPRHYLAQVGSMAFADGKGGYPL